MMTPKRSTSSRDATARVVLYWLPLGAGGPAIVRFSGRLYEAIMARREHRKPCALYHSALQVDFGGATYTIEMGPVLGATHVSDGVVNRGPVGSPLLGQWRLFQYEIRCSLNGGIPDLSYAVAGPQIISTENFAAQQILDLVPSFPIYTWGRDELRTGDMWNSNSLISWLLSRSGLDTSSIHPPQGGRAPGWIAGLVIANPTTAATCALRDSVWPGPLWGPGHRLTAPIEDQLLVQSISPPSRNQVPPL